MMTPAALQCRRKFLRYFPGGFRDERYLDWERGYKMEAHARWQVELSQASFRALLESESFDEVAMRAIRIESRTNLLFSFEKMALRDAVKSAAGAKRLATALFAFLHGPGGDEARFTNWCAAVRSLPRRQTRVLTWPVVTVFGFLAQPGRHIFLKPNVTRIAAAAYGVDFPYASTPNWETYSALLNFAKAVRRDLADLRPRDLIDIQSFLWVQGSDEYRGRTFRPVPTTSVRRPNAPRARVRV